MRIRSVFPLLLIAACATNPYAYNYTAAYTAPKPETVIKADTLQVLTTANFYVERSVIENAGYAEIGISVFNAPVRTVTEAQLRATAADVGAKIVLLCADTTNTATGPVGADSSYRPKSGGADTVVRADFLATYYVRYRNPVGLHLSDVNDGTKARLHVRAAAVAMFVDAGSPADRAGILAGDILLQVDGLPLQRWVDVYALMDQRAGTRLDLVFDRKGERLRKSVQVLP